MSSTAAGCDRVIFDNTGEMSATTSALVWHGLAVLDTLSSRFDKQCPPGANCCLWFLPLCRGFSQRKQREPVDGSDSPKSGARWQDCGKTVYVLVSQIQFYQNITIKKEQNTSSLFPPHSHSINSTCVGFSDRLVLIATNGATIWTLPLKRVILLVAATCWVRTWKYILEQVKMEVTGSFVPTGIEAMRRSAPASRVCLPRSTRTTTTSSLGLLEHITGEVFQCVIVLHMYFIFSLQARCVPSYLMWSVLLSL